MRWAGFTNSGLRGLQLLVWAVFSALCRRGSYRVGRRSEFRQPSEVLRGGGEQELVASPGRAAQSQTSELQDAFEMGEQHFDLLSAMTRSRIFRRLGDRSRDVTSVLIQISRDFAEAHIWTALGSQRAASCGVHV